MKEFFSPLKVFVAGMAVLLVGFMFMPAVDTAVTGLSANTSAVAAQYWGWSWLMTTGVVKWLWFVGGFLGVCFATGVAFLYRRRY